MSIYVALLAGCVLTMILGKFVLAELRKLKAGQEIRQDGPTWHNSKAGTPTMGGIAFILGSGIVTFACGWQQMLAGDFAHLYVYLFALIFGLIGFVDDYRKVRQHQNEGLTAKQKFVLQLLEIGPYRHLRDMSPMAVYKRWQTEIHVGLLVLLLLILNEFRLRGLVAKRTSELSDALSALEASQAEAAVVRDQLGALERKNIAAQMSGMIAHEIKSPVGAIRNFAAVVKILLKDAIAQNPNARTAVEGIDAEALKIAGIVDRVRGYVKNRTANHVLADLKRAVDRGVRAFKLGKLASVPVLVQMPNEPATVLGDGLELELLVLNLVKNAAEAVHEQTDEHGRATGRVIVTLAAIRSETPPEGCGRRQWMLTVADNGRKLTEAEKACLMHSLESVKPDGLGLGLSIVRGIADSHGAKIEFVAKPAGGVVVSVLFDELDEEAAARAAGAIDAGRN